MTKSMENTLNGKGLTVQSFNRHSASLRQINKIQLVFKDLSNLIQGYNL